MIDTLMYVKKLEAAGIPREQAELQVQIMADIVDRNYSTKQDLKDLGVGLKYDMKELRAELKQDMSELRTELQHDMKELRTELKHDMARLGDTLTIKLGSIMVVGIGLIATIIKFF